jgi:hypothetical protein
MHKIFYKAKLDSWNFQFEAYAETEILAKEHLKKGLRNHAKQYGLSKDWWHEYQEDIYAIEIKLGTPSFNSCYRDNSPILETK